MLVREPHDGWREADFALPSEGLLGRSFTAGLGWACNLRMRIL